MKQYTFEIFINIIATFHKNVFPNVRLIFFHDLLHSDLQTNENYLQFATVATNDKRFWRVVDKTYLLDNLGVIT